MLKMAKLVLRDAGVNVDADNATDAKLRQFVSDAYAVEKQVAYVRMTEA